MLQPTADPTYGELVEDLGYKKVFCVDPSRLVDPEAFPIWEKQRVFREARANKIAKAMATSKFAFPGVISVFETPEGRAIIDGQHRVGALRKLRSDNLWPDDRRILVEVHTAETEEEVSNRPTYQYARSFKNWGLRRLIVLLYGDHSNRCTRRYVPLFPLFPGTDVSSTLRWPWRQIFPPGIAAAAGRRALCGH